jgi:hypothetical protein
MTVIIYDTIQESMGFLSEVNKDSYRSTVNSDIGR